MFHSIGPEEYFIDQKASSSHALASSEPQAWTAKLFGPTKSEWGLNGRSKTKKGTEIKILKIYFISPNSHVQRDSISGLCSVAKLDKGSKKVPW